MSIQPAKKWGLGIAMLVAIVIMATTIMNKDFSNKIIGLEPHSEVRVVEATGKLGSVESPTLQRKGLRRLVELEVATEAGQKYQCSSWGKSGILCEPLPTAKH